jgi:3-deoxy-D-manno-octulosonic-acid transferase
MTSLSLRAYKALVRRGRAEPLGDWPARPGGTLIWGVAGTAETQQALIYLCDRLSIVRGPCTLVLTQTPQGNAPAQDLSYLHALPEDTATASRAFLDHWKPDICVWMDEPLRPALISEAKDRAIPMLLINAGEDVLTHASRRWLPHLARDTVGAFRYASAIDRDTQRSLQRYQKSHVDMCDPLQVSTHPPAADLEVLQTMRDTLAGRAVWVAAHVQTEEINAILAAHRASTKFTHRLLLILVCANFPTSLEARTRLASEGLRTAVWDDGDKIDENTQVLMVEDPDDIGLWYRLAPACFLASSLCSGYGGCDPYPAASLGSAIIYGPNVGKHLTGYTRLASVGAARIVNDREGLARAVSNLLASDQAASMAHAAWQTISDGAEATDRVLELVQDALDDVEALT